MTVPEILAVARTARIVLDARGDRLHVEAPRGALTPELRTTLLARKPALLAVLSRLQAMRALAGQTPVAMACRGGVGGPGWCFSCGVPLGLPAVYGRCGPCAVAAELYYAAGHPGEQGEGVA